MINKVLVSILVILLVILFSILILYVGFVQVMYDQNA